MKTIVFFGAIIGAVVTCCFPTDTTAQTAPPLGGSATFAALANSTITNTGSTTLTGNVGVSPGSAITGFPPGTVTNGTLHSNDALAIQAQADTVTAYNNLAGQACTTDLTGQDLAGKTLTPGVYCFSTSAPLSGALTLDAQGNAAAIFVFQIGSTLTTSSNASVSVINGAVGCNAFWQVGSSAVLGSTTSFAGNILALTSITLNNGATNQGRLLAANGAIVLQSNSATNCQVATPVTLQDFGVD